MPDPAPTRSGVAADRVAAAVERLRSLHDGEAGLIEVVRLGKDAIPALRSLLIAREPSGIFQPRCRAIEALAALNAFGVIGEFLESHEDAVDPVERLGDDAVTSSAGRALARLHEPWVYDVLLAAAHRRLLQGVLFGLGSFRSIESLPPFIEALGEDDLRLASQAVLRSFGRRAAKALIAAAVDLEDRDESESHLRKRRSALTLLLEVDLSERSWPKLQHLLEDPDRQISLLACELCSKIGNRAGRRRLKDRLTELRIEAGWLERGQIDELLKVAERS